MTTTFNWTNTGNANWGQANGWNAGVANGATSNATINVGNVFVGNSNANIGNLNVDGGNLFVNNNGQSLTITLYDGERIAGVPGSAQFQIIKKFSQLTVPVQLPALDVAADLEGAPTRELIGAAALDRQAQLQWRIALPIMCGILSSFAVALDSARPDEHAYQRD